MPQFWSRSLRAVRNQDLGGALSAELRRVSRSSFALLLLKGVNAAITAALNFILAYVMIRIVGLQAYAFVAGLLALAALVVQSDLGITGLAFFKLRTHYLCDVDSREASRDDQDLITTIALIYVVFAA